MWIFIPGASSDEEGWVGHLEARNGQSTEWNFELVRRITLNSFYFENANPFAGAYTAVGLLDLTEEVTLILPHALSINTSHRNLSSREARTKITGRSHGLLKGLQIRDGDEKLFTRIEFESELFSVWCDAGAGSVSADVPDVTITNIGVFRFRAFQTPVGRDKYTVELKLCEPVSLRDTIEISASFEVLMGFLVGSRPQLPIFRLFTGRAQPGGQIEIGHLEIGYQKHNDDDLRNRFTAIHLRGVGSAEIGTILEAFYADRDRIVGLIHGIEYVRHFSNNVDDNFRLIVPLLDEVLCSTFKDEAEISFDHVESRFFNYINEAKDGDLAEFSRKHIKVVKSKTPSLKTLLERAIVFNKSKGFNLKQEFGERIQKKRAAAFHSMSFSNSKTILLTYEEGNAAAAMLMLIVFGELGIDISAIAPRRNAFDGVLRVCFDTLSTPSTPRVTFLT